MFPRMASNYADGPLPMDVDLPTDVDHPMDVDHPAPGLVFDMQNVLRHRDAPYAAADGVVDLELFSHALERCVTAAAVRHVWLVTTVSPFQAVLPGGAWTPTSTVHVCRRIAHSVAASTGATVRVVIPHVDRTDADSPAAPFLKARDDFVVLQIAHHYGARVVSYDNYNKIERWMCEGVRPMVVDDQREQRSRVDVFTAHPDGSQTNAISWFAVHGTDSGMPELATVHDRSPGVRYATRDFELAAV